MGFACAPIRYSLPLAMQKYMARRRADKREIDDACGKVFVSDPPRVCGVARATCGRASVVPVPPAPCAPQAAPLLSGSPMRHPTPPPPSARSSLALHSRVPPVPPASARYGLNGPYHVELPVPPSTSHPLRSHPVPPPPPLRRVLDATNRFAGDWY